MAGSQGVVKVQTAVVDVVIGILALFAVVTIANMEPDPLAFSGYASFQDIVSSVGLLITAGFASVLALGFDLSSIASIGSAIALIVFALVTLGHFRLRAETRAKVLVLCAADAESAPKEASSQI